MCKNCYEQYVERAGKVMLFCKLRENEDKEMLRLCVRQRFCSEIDKYIPHKQKGGCKQYE